MFPSRPLGLVHDKRRFFLGEKCNCTQVQQLVAGEPRICGELATIAPNCTKLHPTAPNCTQMKLRDNTVDQFINLRYSSYNLLL